MFARVVLSLALAIPLAACSSVSDRYAFWRDGNAPPSTAHAPNLGDVPDAPANTDGTLAEIEAIRVRLEQDRNDAQLAVQNQNPIIATELQQPYHPAASAYQPTPTNILNNTMQQPQMDAAYPVMALPPQQQELPQAAAPQPQNWESGNTVYRYNSTGESYVYGQSAVHIRSQQAYSGAEVPAPHYVSDDPSIAIDWSALADPAPAYGRNQHGVSTSVVTSGQPLIYYAHGSARLNKQDREELRRVANEIKSAPNNVVIIGHASQQTGKMNALTSRKVNLDMSAKRSLGVAHELTRLGVDPNKLRTAAMGDSFAGVNDNHSRRVDILFDN